MNGYTKLFGSIVASTIWTEDDKTRIIWITMLAMADQHGEVEASVPGLAKFANVSLEDTEKALLKLSSPDKYSRSKEFEGRRIQEIDGGWLILNHGKYREKASLDDRREQARVRAQRFRDKDTQNELPIEVTQNNAPSRTITQNNDKKKHTHKHTQKQEAVIIVSLVQEIFDNWNKTEGIPATVLVLSDKRRRTLEIRLRDKFFRDNWRAALEKIPASEFLTGSTGWKPSLNKILQPDSVAKIMEGKYNGKSSFTNRGQGARQVADRNKGTANEHADYSGLPSSNC